jgi:hypothetical protein
MRQHSVNMEHNSRSRLDFLRAELARCDFEMAGILSWIVAPSASLERLEQVNRRYLELREHARQIISELMRLDAAFSEANSASSRRLTHHRLNDDGTYDSICTRCFVTIVRQQREADLAPFELTHICNPAVLHQYTKSPS